MSSRSPQRKRSQGSRVDFTSTASKSASTQPTRANSIATMTSSSQYGRRDVGTGSGSIGSGKKKQVKTEVWDPYQSDCMTPGCRGSSKDLLGALNEMRRGQNACCRPPPCHAPPRNTCESGESDSSSTTLENGRRTAEFLYDIWCQQKLCDVVLRCCGEGNAEETILAHKVQLGSNHK